MEKPIMYTVHGNMEKLGAKYIGGDVRHSTLY